MKLTFSRLFRVLAAAAMAASLTSTLVAPSGASAAVRGLQQRQSVRQGTIRVTNFNSRRVVVMPNRRVQRALNQRDVSRRGFTTGNLTNHGGPVMHNAVNYAIYWLPKGTHFEPQGSDASYESLINRYFRDDGGTPYYNINSQYTDASGPSPNVTTFGGQFVDTTPFPASGCTAPPGDIVCLTSNQIANEAANAMSLAKWTPGINKEYFVYTPNGTAQCFTNAAGSKCNFNSYCAWHSAFGGPSNANTTVFAFMGVVTNEGGCVGYSQSPNNDLSADAEISTTAHEQFEAVTDPTAGGGWFFGDTAHEIGDECNYVYGQAFNASGADEILNGHPYAVQQEWSNAVSGCASDLVGQSVGNPGGTVTTIGPTTAVRGQTVTYTVNYGDTSTNEQATNVVITDTLPSGVSYVATTNGPAPTVSGSTVTWNVASLGVEQTGTITYEAVVGNGLATGSAAVTCSEIHLQDSLGNQEPPKTNCSIATIQGALTVTTTDDGGCSDPQGLTLRCAIADANGAGKPDTISFDIATAGNSCSGAPELCTISVTSPLPALTKAGTTIDGYTQPGARANSRASLSAGDNAAIGIQLNGSKLSSPANGLILQSDGQTVQGLSLTGFLDAAIELNGGSGDSVTGSFLGPANFDGIFAENNTSSDVIGGSQPNLANVISGNTNNGVSIVGGSLNEILGNYIGLDAGGQVTRPNRNDGVFLSGATGDFVGGLVPSTGNAISGNGNAGVEATGSTITEVFNNEIGTDVLGSDNGLGNSIGVYIHDGTTGAVGLSNIIEGNKSAGVLVGSSSTDSSTHVSVSHNQMEDNGSFGIHVNGETAASCSIGAHAGPNDNTPCPTIQSASAGGTVSGTACAGCTVDIYTAIALGAELGHGEGKNYLGTATAGSGGFWSASVTYPNVSALTVTATATTTSGGGDAETSQFSPDTAVGHLTVTSTGDAASCPNGPGQPGYTLRCAIEQADIDGSLDTISFAIPNGDAGCAGVPKVCTIAPTGGVQALTASNTTIDGYSQAGSSQNTNSSLSSGDNAVITIRIDGAKAGSTGGLALEGTGDTIDGLSITNFALDGIDLNGPSAVNDHISGNLIGLTPTGLPGPNYDGVTIENGASNAIVGSAGFSGANVISANHHNGVADITAGYANIWGNLIGTDPTGNSFAGNANDGVFVAGSAGALIGVIAGSGPSTPAVGAANLIDANHRDGVEAVSSSSILVEGNFIGSNANGETDGLGNLQDGVLVDTASTALISQNTIAGNTNQGVGVGLNASDSKTHVAITSNSIFENGPLGISLAPAGTVHCASAPPGPNDYLTCPVINAVTTTGNVSGIACKGCLVQVFQANDDGEDAGHGEGGLYLGQVTANAACTPSPCPGSNNASWSIATGHALPLGQTVSATATVVSSPLGIPYETSEFALDVKAQPLFVTSTGDSNNCPNGSGQPGYTLRCAIAQANSFGSHATIAFKIPASDTGCAAATIHGQHADVCTIAPKSALPALTAGFIAFKGYSQPGAMINTSPSADNAVIAIRIDGSKAGKKADGITIRGASDALSGISVTGFKGAGVHISGSAAADDSLSGSDLGLTPTGKHDGNGTGVLVNGGAGQNVVGGVGPASVNVVGANAGNGVEISGGTANAVTNDLIGVIADAATAASNHGNGVYAHGGAVGTVSFNTIEDNARAGVLIGASATDTRTHLVATLNTIFGNHGLGIDLAPAGVVSCSGAGRGPNDNLACPKISSAAPTKIAGTACAGCTVELFVTGTPKDASGHGQALRFVNAGTQAEGSSAVADAEGKWSMDVLTGTLAKGQYVTATATTPRTAAHLETSEFAANVKVG